jgi:hypothetical protein
VAAHDPIDPRVRLAIAQWPDDAPRRAVSTFCAEHGISRKSFYELRRRARLHGPAAVLEPRSRRPAVGPSKLTEDVKDQAVAVRAALAPWRGSCASGAWPAPSRGSGTVRPGGGSSTRPRTPAGSWTPLSTSSPAAASA